MPRAHKVKQPLSTKISRHVQLFFIGANAVAVLFFWLSCASVYIHPETFPKAVVLSLGFPIFVIGCLFFIPFWLLFSWRKVWISLLGLALGGNSLYTYCPINYDASPPQEAIKIMSYNVLNFDNAWKNDKGEYPVINYIKDSKADIICYQEGLLSESKSWRDKNIAPLSHTPYNTATQAGTFNWVGIISRYPILSQEIITSSETNGSVAYKLLMAKGDTIIVINNHLESNKLSRDDKTVYKEIITGNDSAQIKIEQESRRLAGKLSSAAVIRAIQADSVHAYIARQHLPIIMCGDLNDTPISYAHRRIGKGLSDAFVQSGQGLGYSFNHDGIFVRIDHIFYSPHWQSYDCKIDKQVDFSDHFPITTYLTRVR